MKSSSNTPSRRSFLKQSAALSVLGAGSPFALNLAAMGNAAAQSSSASDYKALVCVFLAGGNDTFNTVLATDPSSFGAYTATRSSIALQSHQVLPLYPARAIESGRSLGLHPQLAGLQNLFNNKRRLAVVTNVGPLVEPMNKDEYMRSLKRKPSKLFSHNDQQSTWQALAPEGASLGWGGRLADLFASSNGNSLFTGISAAGNSVWVSGQNVKQYQMQPSGVIRMGVSGTIDHVWGSQLVGQALHRVATTTRSAHPFEADLAEVNRRAIAADKVLGSALPSAAAAPFGPSNLLTYLQPDGTMAINPLAQQLQVVARTIACQSKLGMKRQVFFVSLGGFDTHDDQARRHANLMAQLNHAMVYFDNVLTALGMSDEVTTFTASDFGRSFTSNGDGTDHGWGAHHFVMGGAVQGGTVVGDIPTYSLKNARDNLFDGSPDQLANGSLLPKISVDQYGGTLGRWFGAGDAVNTIFPNLRNFSGTLPNLMRA